MIALGIFLIALPFAAAFILAWRTIGLWRALGAFGITALIVAMIGGGVYCLALAGG